jgi:hypothetical protein
VGGVGGALLVVVEADGGFVEMAAVAGDLAKPLAERFGVLGGAVQEFAHGIAGCPGSVSGLAHDIDLVGAEDEAVVEDHRIEADDDLGVFGGREFGGVQRRRRGDQDLAAGQEALVGAAARVSGIWWILNTSGRPESGLILYLTFRLAIGFWD